MRLRFTPIEDYVHTVEALINYGELYNRVEPVRTDPFEIEEALFDDNPLSTVPTLILENRRVLYGGPIVYEYLDGLHGRQSLFPAENTLAVRQLLWLADGLFDQWVRVCRETVIEPEMRRTDFIERQWTKTTRCLDELNRWVGSFGPLDIGQMRTVGALAFLDRVYGSISEKLGPKALPAGYDWRDKRSDLTAWYDSQRENPIFTTPIIPPE